MARLLELLMDSAWDVHLFDVAGQPFPHPELPPVTLHLAATRDHTGGPDAPVAVRPAVRIAALADLVRALRPSIVHSHELLEGAAITDAARHRLGGDLGAPWVVTTWGGCFQRAVRRGPTAARARSILAACDHLGADCHRDLALGRALGFAGQTLGVWPVPGGLDLDAIEALRTPGPSSGRRAVMLKGVVEGVGRARVAVAALEACADLLAGRELIAYQVGAAIADDLTAAAARWGMAYRPLSGQLAAGVPYAEVLRGHGRARVSLALNHTDGLSGSFLEALALGALPVHGSSCCGHEITPPGRGALFVDPDDPDAVARAVRRALTDDALVDGAEAINRQVASEHLDRRRIRRRVLDAYDRVLVGAGGIG